MEDSQVGSNEALVTVKLSVWNGKAGHIISLQEGASEDEARRLLALAVNLENSSLDTRKLKVKLND